MPTPYETMSAWSSATKHTKSTDVRCSASTRAVLSTSSSLDWAWPNDVARSRASTVASSTRSCRITAQSWGTRRTDLLGRPGVGSGADLQGAALDAAAGLEQLAEVDADRYVATLTQLRGKVDGRRREHDVPAVGDGVEAQDDGVGLGGQDRVGEEALEDAAAARAERLGVVG